MRTPVCEADHFTGKEGGAQTPVFVSEQRVALANSSGAILSLSRCIICHSFHVLTGQNTSAQKVLFTFCALDLRHSPSGCCGLFQRSWLCVKSEKQVLPLAWEWSCLF